MRILITGGAGFIGSHLARELLNDGHRIRVLDTLDPQVHGSSGVEDVIPPEAEFVRGDVRDESCVSKAVEGVDCIYHFAAQTGVGQSMYEMREYIDCNVCGTAQLIQSVLKNSGDVKRLVISSSRAVYGEGKYHCPACGEVYPPPRDVKQLDRGEWEPLCPKCSGKAAPVPTDEEKPLQPGSVYAISKREQEDLALCAGQAYDLPVTVLRLFNVYGSGQSLSNPYTGIISIFSSRIRNGLPPLIYEDGLESRDFVHVSDVVEACRLVLKSDKADGEKINIGSGTALSIFEIAERMIAAMGADLKPEVIAKYRFGDIRHCTADIGKARRLIGYEPKTDFDTGIREFLDWAKGREYEERLDAATDELKRRGLYR